MKTNKLTIKQENFCQAFIRTGDKSAAYREAYSCAKMKAETINKRASELFSNGEVAGRVATLQSKVAAIAETKFGITATEMLRHLNILRNARIDEYVYFKNGRVVFKDFDMLTPEQLMCIESIKTDRSGRVELKLHGKEWTIEKINKHIGFYEKDNVQKSSILVPEDRTARLQQLKDKLHKMS